MMKCDNNNDNADFPENTVDVWLEGIFEAGRRDYDDFADKDIF